MPMNNSDQIITPQEELQKRWEQDFHHLFMLMRGKFRPGTLLTITARMPGEDPNTDFCWTMEKGTDELRAFLDRLDERQQKREIVPPSPIVTAGETQVIKPNGFKAKN